MRRGGASLAPANPTVAVTPSPGSAEQEALLAHLMAERVAHAVRVTQAVTYPGFYHGADAALTIDWVTGLWLNHDTRGDVRPQNWPAGTQGGRDNELTRV